MTEPAPALTPHGIIVLLIDDQPIVADAVRRMLAPEKDISFHYCQDPTRAIPVAAELRPTVILQDLVMPDIDGMTLVRFFRSHPVLRDVPLIVLSSKEEPVTKAEAFGLGASDYLVKLPDRVELVARIRHHSKGYINLLERNEAFAALQASQQALARELARAADYVVSLLPPPQLDGPVRTDWRFVPSAELGGDSFGYHPVDDDHFAVYLLDVCGHGVGSALLSVSALNTLRRENLTGVDFRAPAQVLAALNEAYPMESHNNLYFTIWYGVFQRSTRRLRYASAGHPPALLLAGSTDPVELVTPNMVIGGIPGLPYDESAVEIPESASLYVFSDGVYEVTRPDGTMWSLPELKEFLSRPPVAGASEIDLLYHHLQTLHGQSVLEDDFSLLKVIVT